MNIKQTASTFVHLIDNRRQHVVSRARRRLWRLHKTTTVRSLDTRAQALDTLDTWTDPLADTFVLNHLATLVDQRLARVTTTGIEDYDTRTAKDLAGLVRDLTDVAQLEKIARYEAAHKNRKTVTGAVDKQLKRIEPTVVSLEPWVLTQPEDQAAA